MLTLIESITSGIDVIGIILYPILSTGGDGKTYLRKSFRECDTTYVSHWRLIGNNLMSNNDKIGQLKSPMV